LLLQPSDTRGFCALAFNLSTLRRSNSFGSGAHLLGSADTLFEPGEASRDQSKIKSHVWSP
jgi:hypothetical protein